MPISFLNPASITAFSLAFFFGFMAFLCHLQQKRFKNLRRINEIRKGGYGDLGKKFGPNDFMFSEEQLDKVRKVPKIAVEEGPALAFEGTEYRFTVPPPRFVPRQDGREVITAACALAHAAHTTIALDQIPSVTIHRLWEAVRKYEESK